MSIGRGTTCASFGCSLAEGKEECTNRCLNQTDCKSFSYIVEGNNKGFCFLYTSTCTSDCTGAGNFKSSPGYDTQSWNKNYATGACSIALRLWCADDGVVMMITMMMMMMIMIMIMLMLMSLCPQSKSTCSRNNPWNTRCPGD